MESPTHSDFDRLERVGISELSAHVGLSANWLRRLADRGEIPSWRTPGGHRRFDVQAVRAALERREPSGRAGLALSAVAVEPARSPDWGATYALQGLEEHAVWMSIPAELGVDPTTGSGRIFAYAFNEMLNNAIDHSGGTTVTVDVWADARRLSARFVDDGVGVFAHLRARRGLEDEIQAVAELTKGKVTTAPERHTGEGIFFTSKAVDVFQLSAGRLRWTVDNMRLDQALGQVRGIGGTTVVVEVAAQTTRVLREVFAEFTEDGEFSRSRPSVKLHGIGTTFVSRSEARRILAGMERFSEVEIDFAGVADVGQGFVDEVFRVWPAQHPGSTTLPVNMNEAVTFMVHRGLPRRTNRPNTLTQ